MKRHQFIVLLGGAAAWPLAAPAEQPGLPVVGFISSRSPTDSIHELTGFRKGLAEAGYVEGQNVMVDFRWTNGDVDRLPAAAKELVRRPVSVIASFGDASPVVKAATATIPVIFGIGGDPVGRRLVASLNRPGGNMTGAAFLTSALGAKRLGLLRELVPGAELIALLVNPNTPIGGEQTRDVQEAARALGQRLVILEASSDGTIDAAFAAVARQHVAALLVGADTFFDTRRERLVGLAAQYAVPAMYQFRQYAVAGGLISYGTSITDMYRQVGLYVGRVLTGEKPADLPVVQVARFELVINIKTAKALGLQIPPTLLALADEVIE
jgi:putative ABC transport system substrate-binding protein